MGRSDSGVKPFFSVPALEASPVKDSNFAKWDSLKVDGMQSAIVMNVDGMDIYPYIADWIAMATSFSGDQKKSESSTTALPFQSIQITRADIHVTDNRITPAMTHHITPVNMDWKLMDNEKTAINVTVKIVSPGKGTFAFNGEGSRELFPVTLRGKPSLTLENITAYQQFYQGSLPIAIEKSGLKVEGDLNIKTNQLDSSVDLYLLQPEFSIATGNLPIKVDSRAMVSTLNTLKDKQGVIAFKQNKVTGDISNPQFSFGTSIANILTTAILKKGIGIITLPKDMAEGGVDVIKKGAGAVGEILGGILKPKN
jgi:hypothetical protein